MTEAGEFVVGDGEFRFSGVPTGRYNLSVTGDDEWGSALEQDFLLFQDRGQRVRRPQGVQRHLAVPEDVDLRNGRRTMPTATDQVSLRGDGQRHRAPSCCASRAATTVATGRTDTTTVLGTYSFADIVGGPLRGEGVERRPLRGRHQYDTHVDHSPVLDHRCAPRPPRHRQRRRASGLGTPPPA